MKRMWSKSVVYKIVIGIMVLVIGVGALGLSAFAEDIMPTPTPATEVEPTEAPTTPSPTATIEATAAPDSNENVDNNVNNNEKTDENTGEKEVNEEEKNEEKNEENKEENQIMMAGTMQNITIDPNGGSYKGNNGKVSEAVASGTVYELNEIPVRPGYTFQGWKLSGGGGVY